MMRLLMSCMFIGVVQIHADARLVLLDQVKNHLAILNNHIQDMESLQLKLTGPERDQAIQELATKRNEFNKSLCDRIKDVTPRKRLIGFYVYESDKSDDAIQKIQEHIDAVKKHEVTIQQLFTVMSNVGCNWAVNDQTTPELEATVDQTMYDYVSKLIVDFNTTQCDSVGFGYIPAKK